MRPSSRLERIPPYLFAAAGAQDRREARRRHRRDQPGHRRSRHADLRRRSSHAAQRAVADPSTHTYPTNRGRAEFREAVAAFYARRFGVTLDPETEVMPAIGAKECIFNLNLAFLDPGDVALASDPGYPVYTGGPLMAGGEPVLMGLVPELGFAPDLDAIDADTLRRARLMFINYPNNPTGAVVPDGLFEPPSSSPAPTTSWSSTTTPTPRRPTTATWRRRSWPRPAPRRSASRCSRCPRATT